MKLFNFGSNNADPAYSGNKAELTQGKKFSLQKIQTPEENYVSLDFFEDYEYNQSNSKAVFEAIILLNFKISFQGELATVQSVQFSNEGMESEFNATVPFVYISENEIKLEMNINEIFVNPILIIVDKQNIYFKGFNLADFRMFYTCEG